jgi:chromate transporter
VQSGVAKRALAVFPLPALWLTGLKGPATTGVLLKLLTYFTTGGLFVFGSGLAIVPFLHGGVVIQHEWLTERQFLDAVAVAMITPGPVVITVAFIGHLVAGPVGATVAAIAVFLPCFLIVVLVAPHYRRLAGRGKIKTFVSGVTAGAIGAIAGAAIVLTRRSLVDNPDVAHCAGNADRSFPRQESTGTDADPGRGRGGNRPSRNFLSCPLTRAAVSVAWA